MRLSVWRTEFTISCYYDGRRLSQQGCGGDWEREPRCRRVIETRRCRAGADNDVSWTIDRWWSIPGRRLGRSREFQTNPQLCSQSGLIPTIHVLNGFILPAHTHSRCLYLTACSYIRATALSSAYKDPVQKIPIHIYSLASFLSSLSS